MTVNILFVDDEPEFVRAHINALEESGYNVTHVRSYTEALNALQQTFHLIVLDLILPPSDTDLQYGESEPSAEVGLSLHRVIREELGLTQTPIIFFTVVNELETRHQIQKIEAKFGLSSSILVKPMLPSKLLIQVRQLVGGRDEQENQ
jgi:CheY-like chemotaxis protein